MRPRSPFTSQSKSLAVPESTPESALDQGQESQSPEFFLVVIPGLEDLALWELRRWRPEVEAKIERGGISLHLPLEEGVELNRLLKIPTRILLRLSSFGCRDFPKLFRKISGFPWGKFVGTEAGLSFSASSHGSRLRIKKRIEETCQDGWRAHLKKSGRKIDKDKDHHDLEILVRFVDDVCTLSLDTSGEALYKRGLRAMISEAPLRETIAAALISLMIKSAGGATPEEWVDPMMGGGTLLLEALTLFEPVTTRGFAFEDIEGLKASRPLIAARQKTCLRAVRGYELDEKVIGAARENLSQAIRSLGSTSSTSVEIESRDFFTAEVLPKGSSRWLIANPPYGERLKIEGRLSDYYARLFETAEKVVHPERAGFILPAKVDASRLQIPRGWRLVENVRFSNGGLPVAAVVFECPARVALDSTN